MEKNKAKEEILKLRKQLEIWAIGRNGKSLFI